MTSWQITLEASHEQAYAILAQDPVWNSFALVDLEPPMRAYSQFATASQHESHAHALCLVLRHPIIGEVFSPFGNEEGVAAILQRLTLPEHPLLQVQEAHIPAFKKYYRPETTWKKILRMAIPASAEPAFTPASRYPVKQMTLADLPALQELYAQHLESVFAPDLFAQGLFFGVYQDERIIAAGGTHALAPAHGIAVLGNILTVPEARRQGWGTAITAALVTALRARHFSTIVLNVFADNLQAIRIYQRLGFQTYHRFLTGKAIRAS